MYATRGSAPLGLIAAAYRVKERIGVAIVLREVIRMLGYTNNSAWVPVRTNTIKPCFPPSSHL